MAKYGKLVALLVAAALVVSMLALGGCSTPAAPEPAKPAEEKPAADLKLVTAGQLTCGSDTTFPPFESMNGSTAEGFDVDLIAAMAQEMGLTSKFQTEIF
ncbi:MAG: transporter substrate-binding domain-containing protein, partial [Coriobacteriia bacterium]|nr:transporter substrate-binding domain-containing protein [Coriobacteriia bacterium]